MQTDNDIKKGRALVVDDVPYAAHIDRVYCENLGYTVDLADSAEKAMVLFEPGKYQLIILDIALCDKNWLEVFRFIRTEDKKVIIVVTGAYDYVSQLAMQSGANAYLEKPFSLEKLKQALGR